MINLLEGNSWNIVGSSALFSFLAPVSFYSEVCGSSVDESFIQYTIPVGYSEFRDRLDHIVSLKDNWDGRGAEVPDVMVCNNVKLFLDKLDMSILNCLDVDSIEPTPYGTITLDFVNEEKLVSVEMGNSKIGFFSELPCAEELRLREEDFDPDHFPGVLIEAFKVLVA